MEGIGGMGAQMIARDNLRWRIRVVSKPGWYILGGVEDNGRVTTGWYISVVEDRVVSFKESYLGGVKDKGCSITRWFHNRVVHKGGVTTRWYIGGVEDKDGFITG